MSLLFHCAFILAAQPANLAHGHSEVGAGRGRRPGTTTDVTCRWSRLAVLEVRGSSLCVLQTIKVVVFGSPPHLKTVMSALPLTQAGCSYFLLQLPGCCREAAPSRSPLGCLQPRAPQLTTRSTWAPWPCCRCGRALRAGSFFPRPAVATVPQPLPWRVTPLLELQRNFLSLLPQRLRVGGRYSVC